MGNLLEKYIDKHSVYKQLVNQLPHPQLKLIIIIPAYNEPQIFDTLNSLKKCEPAKYPTEVLIVINHSCKAPKPIIQQNDQTYNDILEWIKNESTEQLKFHCILKGDLPQKHAGAGLARKIAMDEAIRRLNSVNNENGIIASLDADTLVSRNYICDIQNAFSKKKKLSCAIFYFEHFTTPETSDKNHKAIVLYELYLRYFKQALKYTGFPYAFHTIGSCFAVTASAYAKQGGMNRKQGGEDFYFLHKIFPLGNVAELNHIKVFPSSRPSNRVPFGTGPAIQKIMNDNSFVTYQPIYFSYLKNLFDSVKCLYMVDYDILKSIFDGLHPTLQQFIGIEDFTKKLNEINGNCASKNTFSQRFYQWFDAFKIIKYLNFVHLSNKRIPVQEAVQQFFKMKNITVDTAKTPAGLLDMLRKEEMTDLL